MWLVMTVGLINVLALAVALFVARQRGAASRARQVQGNQEPVGKGS